MTIKDPLGLRISGFVLTDLSVDGKDSLPYAEKYLERQPVPPEFDSWIYDSTGNYRPQVGRILFVAEEVRKAGRGYREFWGQLGNHENSRECIMRSEIRTWTELDLNEGVKAAQYLWQLTA